MDENARERLKSQVISAFAAREEIYQIHLFGREVWGQCDRYSDIDLMVCSNDLARTQAEYLEVFRSISPVRAVFPLEGDANGYAEMILLKDASPYHKIDFSIHADLEGKAWAGPFRLMYEDRQKPSLSQTRLQPVHIHKDIAYKLNDVLFSIARFTKCLFRREIDMYRRWRGITALTLVLLYEKHYGWEAETVKKELGSHEAARLVDNLEHHEKQAVDCIYPPVARVDLAQSYEAALHLIIELSKEKARYFYLPLDYEFIEYMKSFLVTEMCRYSQQHRIGSFESYP